MVKNIKKKVFMKKLQKILTKYNENYLKLAEISEINIDKLIQLYKFCEKIKKNKKKIIIVGNGGSAAIASHFSVDMTKNGKIRCINFNESDLLTCFANDYGYQNWVRQALKFYCDEDDLIILISSSGKSLNMINAAKSIDKKKNILITFTGFNGNNLLSKYGRINFTVNSKNYNIIENIHQYWLLNIVDLFAGNLQN